MFKAIQNGYTFIQESEDSSIKVYDTIGDISDLNPVFVSQESVKSQKDFEIEICYIIEDILKKEHTYNEDY